MEEFAYLLIIVFSLIFIIVAFVILFCLVRLLIVLPDYLRRMTEAFEKIAKK